MTEYPFVRLPHIQMERNALAHWLRRARRENPTATKAYWLATKRRRKQIELDMNTCLFGRTE